MSLNRLINTVKEILENAQQTAEERTTESEEVPEDGTTIEIKDEENGVDETEEETEDVDSDGSEPVSNVSGVGDVYATRLEEAGIETREQLAGANATDLSEKVDISEGRLKTLIENAADE